MPTLIRFIELNELSRAFRVAINGLVSEIRSADKELAERLQEVLMSLTETSR